MTSPDGRRCPRCHGPLVCAAGEPAESLFDGTTLVCAECVNDENFYSAHVGPVPDLSHLIIGYTASRRPNRMFI